MTRTRSPRAIKISHLALKRLDVGGVGVPHKIFRRVIIVRTDPVVSATIEPILAVHEVHALGFGVPHALRARPRRRASGPRPRSLLFISVVKLYEQR